MITPAERKLLIQVQHIVKEITKDTIYIDRSENIPESTAKCLKKLSKKFNYTIQFELHLDFI